MVNESVNHSLNKRCRRVTTVAAHRRLDISGRSRVHPAVALIINFRPPVVVILQVQVEVAQDSDLERGLLGGADGTQLTRYRSRGGYF